MSNMSYCRWHNTSGDLRDCAESINEKTSHEEFRAKVNLFRTAIEMLQEVGIDVSEPHGLEQLLKDAETEEEEE